MPFIVKFKKRFIPVVGTAILICLCAYQIRIWFNNYQYQQFTKIAVNAIKRPTKVFQIGFSKCGTSTIAYFFNRNAVPSVHHDHGNLPTSIYYNYRNQKPLLGPEYQRYLVFTDMEQLYKKPVVNVGQQFFKELDKQYPRSKFILNIRNKDAWLESRTKQTISPSNQSLLIVAARLQNISTEEMQQRWSQEWDEHISNVTQYFKDRPNDLLIFDIEQDPPEKLVQFFKDDFNLDPKFYTVKNKTSFKWLNNLWTQLLLGPQHKLFKRQKVYVNKEGGIVKRIPLD